MNDNSASQTALSVQKPTISEIRSRTEEEIGKNFDSWNTQKKEIQKGKSARHFKEREIFYAMLGKNVGYEQDGKGNKFIRPMIVLRKFSKNLLVVIPLSRRNKIGLFYFHFHFNEKLVSCALLSQIRLIDAKRLLNKIGNVPREEFFVMKTKISKLLKLADDH